MSVNYISYDDHWFGTRTVLGFKATNFLLCFDSVGCKGKGTFLPLTPRGSLPEQAREETHTHTHSFNGPFSRTTRVSQYQKSKTNLDFTEARDSKWQWHQLGRIQVCTSLQTDNHASTPPLSFLQA